MGAMADLLRVRGDMAVTVVHPLDMAGQVVLHQVLLRAHQPALILSE